MLVEKGVESTFKLRSLVSDDLSRCSKAGQDVVKNCIRSGFGALIRYRHEFSPFAEMVNCYKKVLVAFGGWCKGTTKINALAVKQSANGQGLKLCTSLSEVGFGTRASGAITDELDNHITHAMPPAILLQSVKNPFDTEVSITVVKGFDERHAFGWRGNKQQVARGRFLVQVSS